MREVMKADANFLEKEKPRLEKHVQKKVEQSVYHTPFRPKVYIRTMKLLKSMRVYFPNASDKHTLFIDSNPNTARAIDNSGGYARFVAGEGPGIGFLKPVYTGENGKTRKSYFPRRWHEAIINGNSSYYKGLESGLIDRYYKHVIKKLEKFS
jgi:hypothetical protein